MALQKNKNKIEVSNHCSFTFNESGNLLCFGKLCDFTPSFILRIYDRCKLYFDLRKVCLMHFLLKLIGWEGVGIIEFFEICNSARSPLSVTHKILLL